MSANVMNKDPKGTVPAFNAGLEKVEAMSPKFHKAAAKALARRWRDYASKLSPADNMMDVIDDLAVGIETLQIAVHDADGHGSVRAAAPSKAPPKRKAVAATKATKAKATKPVRTLSPTRAVPKGGLTASGKKRGRPFGSGKKAQSVPPPSNGAGEHVYQAIQDEGSGDQYHASEQTES